MERRQRLPWRARAAARAATAVNGVSRRLGRGSGTVAGGHVGLAISHDLLTVLAGPRTVALVTGTNGKTTTTAMLTAALTSGTGVPVTNATGANMPAGHVAALAQAVREGNITGLAVLEVDEGYVAPLLAQAKPAALVLLNLSRDQLDRTNEVRMTASQWRSSLAAAVDTSVVANCDDPLVTWAAGSAPRVIWVAAGAHWLADAVGCPACTGRVAFDWEGWSCKCGFSRPEPDVAVVKDPDGSVKALWADGRSLPVKLSVPGRFNVANAVMATVAAGVMGVPAELALDRVATVGNVAGRFAVVNVDGVATRLLLAKNPAGWVELLELVRHDRRPLVIGINARVADGRDPSWLWDVPFEELHGREVVATGDRSRDLAVRLRYAGVPHRTEPDPRMAIAVASKLVDEGASGGGGGHGDPVEFIGNYTAFHELWQS